MSRTAPSWLQNWSFAAGSPVEDVHGARIDKRQESHLEILIVDPDGQIRMGGVPEVGSGECASEVVPGFRDVLHTGAVLRPELVRIDRR
jgi:hypothetical protein